MSVVSFTMSDWSKVCSAFNLNLTEVMSVLGSKAPRREVRRGNAGTSLVSREDWREQAHGPACSLGSITYTAHFEPTATACFGPGGYYEMAELDGVWIFFSQNFQATEPLTFGVIGNLGHDGTRTH